MHFNGTARPPCGQDASGPAHAGCGGGGWRTRRRWALPWEGRPEERAPAPRGEDGERELAPHLRQCRGGPTGRTAPRLRLDFGPWPRCLHAGPGGRATVLPEEGVKTPVPGVWLHSLSATLTKGPPAVLGASRFPRRRLRAAFFFFFSFLRGKVICQHLGIVRISELNYICHMTFRCLPRLTIKNEDYGAGARFITPRVTSVTECFASL